MKEKEIKQFEEEKAEKIIQKIIKISNKNKDLNYNQIQEIIESELKNEQFYENIIDYQAHYSKERIKKEVLSKIYKNEGGDDSLAWFTFYVYIRLPITMIVSFLLMLSIFSNPISGIVGGIAFVIAVTLFYGLKARDPWAYKMNFVILIVETVSISFAQSDIIGFILYLIVVGLFWLLPNWIYFKKREYLFSFSSENLKEKYGK